MANIDLLMHHASQRRCIRYRLPDSIRTVSRHLQFTLWTFKKRLSSDLGAHDQALHEVSLAYVKIIIRDQPTIAKEEGGLNLGRISSQTLKYASRYNNDGDNVNLILYYIIIP